MRSKKNRLLKMLSSGVCLVTLAVPATVRGQSPDQANSEYPAVESAMGEPQDDALETHSDPGPPASRVNEIIVTAQRRAENVQDVPISITAVDAEQLAASGISSLQDLNMVVPSLSTRLIGGAVQPWIRGVGTAGSYVENPVAVYVDGVYLPSQRDTGQDLMDVEQVSVLKGPQGTLFGRNATGGVIQISTREPSSTFELDARTSFDDYETFRSDVFVSGGLTDTVSASLTAQYVHQGQGWGYNPTLDEDVYKIDHSLTFRAKMLFELGDETTLRLAGDYIDRRDSMGPNFQFYPGSIPLAPGFITDYTPYTPRGPVPSVNDQKSYGVNATLTHDLGFAELKSVSSYRSGDFAFAFDFGGTAQLARTVSVDQPYETYTQELQLISSGDGPFEWAMGAYYFHNDIALSPFTVSNFNAFAPAPISPAVIETNSQEITESLAPFAQVTYAISDSTNVTGGLRYTWERRDFEGTRIGISNNGNPFPPLTQFVEDEHITFRELTWRLALDHQFSPDVMGYASYNRGFKSGGYNFTAPGDEPYLPEILDAYEIGLKSDLFGGNVRLNTAVFYYDYQNVQVQRYLNGAANIYNGAAAEIYGVDVDLIAFPAANLQITGAMSWLHAEFINFPDAVFSEPNPTGGRVLFAGDASGNELPYARPLVLTLAIDYDLQTRFGDIHFNVSDAYNSRFFLEPDNFIRQGSYHILNASVRWTSMDGRYSLKVFGKNLANEAVYAQGLTQNTGLYVAYGDTPRVFGIEAGFSY